MTLFTCSQIKEGYMHCRICQSTSRDMTLVAKEMMFGTRTWYEYFKCAECGTLQITHPEQDGTKLYPKHYYSLAQGPTNAGLKERLKRYLYRMTVAYEIGQPTIIGSLLARIRPSMESRALRGIARTDHAILDVGCGTGYLIEALAQLGYKDVTGVKPYITKTITGDGFKVFKGKIEELDGSKKFDVIMLHHSFEHMNNPDEVLKNISQLLSPDGICILRIPVCDSEAFETYREDWGQLDAPRHIFLYSANGVHLLASRHGLWVESVVDDSGIFQFIVSEQYRRGVPLSDERSYYRPLLKRLLSPSVINRSEVHEFSRKTHEVKKTGRGDQRIFYLRKQSEI